MGFEWLGLTPSALATLNNQPQLLPQTIGVIVGLILLVTLSWYIHYRTSKNNGTFNPWYKNLGKKMEEGKAGKGKK